MQTKKLEIKDSMTTLRITAFLNLSWETQITKQHIKQSKIRRTQILSSRKKKRWQWLCCWWWWKWLCWWREGQKMKGKYMWRWYWCVCCSYVKEIKQKNRTPSKTIPTKKNQQQITKNQFFQINPPALFDNSHGYSIETQIAYKDWKIWKWERKEKEEDEVRITCDVIRSGVVNCWVFFLVMGAWCRGSFKKKGGGETVEQIHCT